MARFRVHIVTTTTRRQLWTVDAPTEEEARSKAETQDWAEFSDEEDPQIDTGIDWIEEDESP